MTKRKAIFIHILHLQSFVRLFSVHIISLLWLRMAARSKKSHPSRHAFIDEMIFGYQVRQRYNRRFLFIKRDEFLQHHGNLHTGHPYMSDRNRALPFIQLMRKVFRLLPDMLT
jgi:hypothetical protein